jgi:hypothetical protein
MHFDTGEPSRLVVHQHLENITKPQRRDYRVGPGAVDPDGTGEGISLALPCVLGGFRRVDEPVDAVVVVGAGVVPVCSQDVRNVMPIRTAMRENTCLFIRYSLIAPRRVSGRLKPNELLAMLTPPSFSVERHTHTSGPDERTTAAS